MFLIEKKVLIFDMDETLIHCVDDIESEDPDVIIPIEFPDEEDIVNVIFCLFIFSRLELISGHIFMNAWMKQPRTFKL
jgi:hypothetical protein